MVLDWLFGGRREGWIFVDLKNFCLACWQAFDNRVLGQDELGPAILNIDRDPVCGECGIKRQIGAACFQNAKAGHDQIMTATTMHAYDVAFGHAIGLQDVRALVGAGVKVCIAQSVMLKDQSRCFRRLGGLIGNQCMDRRGQVHVAIRSVPLRQKMRLLCRRQKIEIGDIRVAVRKLIRDPFQTRDKPFCMTFVHAVGIIANPHARSRNHQI